MTPTKSYIDHLAVLKKAAEVAKHVQDLSNSSKSSSFLMQNAAAMAVCAADGLFVILRRIEKELAGDNAGPITVQGALFPPTPADRAVTISELRSLLESWFDSDYQEDDSGTAPADASIEEEKEAQVAEDESEKPVAAAVAEVEEEPEAELSLPAQIKLSIHAAGEDGMGDGDVFDSYFPDGDRPDDEAEELLTRVLWAMIHTGEIEVQYDHLIYRASSPDLRYDVLAMMEAQPELGTEDGLPEDQIVPILIAQEVAVEDLIREMEGEGVPAAADIISQWVHASSPTTRLEILDHFTELGEDEASIVEALEYLISGGHLELSEDGDSASIHAPGQDPLDGLDRDELKEIYEQLTGRKPGRKRNKTLRLEILKWRLDEVKMNAARQHGPEELCANASEAAEDVPAEDDVEPQELEGMEEVADDMDSLL